MATMQWSGLDNIYMRLEKMRGAGDAIGEEMLDAGCEQVENAWVVAIEEAGLVDSGDMARSVGTKRKADKSREVYPLGTDHHGVRNALKAAVQHYGSDKGKIKPTGFFDKVKEYSEISAVPAMVQVWGNHMNK